jgi:VanZ family protein
MLNRIPEEASPPEWTSPLKLLHALWLWTPAVACAAAIHYGSTRPVPPVVVAPIPHMDKLVHAGAYGLLALLLARALHGSSRAALSVAAVAACLWSTAYGAVEEVVQRFLPGRSSDVADLVANAVGAALAAWVWQAAVTRRKRRCPSPPGNADMVERSSE